MIALLQNLASTDLVVIAIVFLLLFGARLIPRWARALRETRDELNDLTKEKKDE